MTHKTRSLAPAALIAALTALPAAADPVVVELYTSQGCSSCPPADAMLGELTSRDDVIALSLHVDYWDWIGWKDTFGHAAFSERQRQYASAAGSTVVYTPQFVIGGSDQVAGPSGMQLADLIQKHQGATADVLEAAGDGVSIAPGAGEGQLIAVSVMPEATVDIMHGENAGHEMTYHNVVHSWDVIGPLPAEGGTVAVPAAEAGYKRIVLAQSLIDGKPGPIIGAAKLD